MSFELMLAHTSVAHEQPLTFSFVFLLLRGRGEAVGQLGGEGFCFDSAQSTRQLQFNKTNVEAGGGGS